MMNFSVPVHAGGLVLQPALAFCQSEELILNLRKSSVNKSKGYTQSLKLGKLGIAD